MANTIQIISVERTGKEAALQTEYGNKSIKTIDGYHFNKNLNSSKFTIISKLLSNKVSQIILTKKNFTKKLSNFIRSTTGSFGFCVNRDMHYMCICY